MPHQITVEQKVCRTIEEFSFGEFVAAKLAIEPEPSSRSAVGNFPPRLDREIVQGNYFIAVSPVL